MATESEPLHVELHDRLHLAPDGPYADAGEHLDDLYLRVAWLAERARTAGTDDGVGGGLAEELDGKIARRVAQTRAAGLDLPILDILSELSEPQQNVLIACLGAAACPRVARWLRATTGDDREGCPRLDDLARLLATEGQARALRAAVLDPRGLLLTRQWLEGEAGGPNDILSDGSRVRLRVGPGLRRRIPLPMPAELLPFSRLERPDVAPYEVVAPPSTAEALLGLFRPHAARRTGPLALLVGDTGTGKRTLASSVAHGLGVGLLIVNGAAISVARDASALLGRVLDATLSPGVLVYLTGAEVLFARESPRVTEQLERLRFAPGPLLLSTSREDLIDSRLDVLLDSVVRLRFPSADDRVQLWERLIPADVAVAPDLDVRLLAQSFPLSGRQIQSAVLGALGALGPSAALDGAALSAAASLQLRADLSLYGEERVASHGLHDLVLSEEPARQLNEVLRACRVHQHVLARWGFAARLSKGRGLCLMFDGDPGTGKTHAAEALAGELGLRLLFVSIPKIVSKWVGETEKNLSRIFRVAHHARALLLFDEADSLFGHRTEVNSSNDRYANMETNSLLQEIEHYDGIVVLTTNLSRNLDKAVERRIAFRVSFPLPGAVERATLWRTLIPREADKADDIGYDELGRRFELAGGHVKNAVLRAAYHAMSFGEPIGMRHLVEAAGHESESLGKLVRKLS